MLSIIKACRSPRNGRQRAGIHTQLDDLQRHLAADRLLLLSHEDNTKATFADLFQQPVRSNDGPRTFLNGGVTSGPLAGQGT